MALKLKLSAFWITFTVFMCHCWIVSGQSNDFKQLTKQEQRILKKSHEAFLLANGGGKLKSTAGAVIPSLQSSYCSEDPSGDIVPGIVFPPEATDVFWEVITIVAGEGKVVHPGWYELLPSGSVNGAILRFYPERVESKYFGVNIIFNYTVTANGVNLPGLSGGDITKVFKTPTEFSFGSDVAICNGSSADLTLANSESGVNYILQRNGVDLPTQEVAGSTGFPITYSVTTAGTYTVRSYTSSCQKMMNGQAVVTVNAAPVLTVSPNIAVCAGESTSLSVTSNQDPDVDYLWSNGGATADITVTPVATTTYTVTGTNRLTGCSSSRTVTVTVNPLPVVSITNPSPVCVNDALVLSANVTGGTAPYQYTWTRPDNSTATGPNLDLSPANVSRNGQYRLVVSDNNLCGSVEATTTITVNALPNISMSALPNGAVCEGTPIEFTASGGTNYTFYLNGVVVQASSPDNTYVLAAPANGDVVRVVGADGNSCLAEVSYTVSVNPLPAVGLVVSPSEEVCAGTNITFMALGGSSYRFYVNDAPQGDWSATNTFQSATLKTGDRVYARVRSAFGCEAQTVTSTVTINQAVATLTSNPTPANICFNDFITFTAGGGVQYEFLVNGAVARPLGGGNIFTSNAIPNGALVTVRVIDVNNCEDISDPIAVTVYPTPNITLTANPSTGVCPVTPITFRGQGGVQYEFKLNGAVVQPLSNTDTYVLAAPNQGDVVAVVGVDGNGCSAESADYPVTVFPNPIPGLSVAPSSTVCSGALLTFTATGGSNYLFYVNNVPQGVWSGNATFQSSTLNNGDVVYARVRTANGCEANSVPITVTINQAVATLASNPTPANICFNDFITFTAGGGVQYEFLVNGVVARALGASNTFISNTIPNGAQVTVRVIDVNNCEDISDPISVTVYSSPNITLSANPSSGVCPGTPITFRGQGGVQYEFKLNGAVVQPLSNTDTYVLAAPNQGDVVAVVGVDGNGCSAESADYPVTVFPNPIPGLSVAPSNTVCAGELLTFTATGGSSYLFYVNNIPQGGWSGNATFQSSTLNNGDVVHVGVRNINDCEANSAPITVTINQIEANISITGPVPGLSTVCRNSNVTFSASPAGAANYEFFATRGGVDVLLYQGNQNILSISNLQNNDEVFVRITDANTCVDNSDKIRVSVVELPVPVVNITPVPLCEGSPVTLTATPGFDKYELFVNGVQVGNSQVSNIFIPAGLKNGDQVVVVAYDVVSAALECYGSSSPKTINFLPLPNITLSSNQPLNTFCEGTNVTFTAANGAQYQFFVNGAMVRDFSPLATYSTNTLRNGDEVTVIGRGANGCLNTSNSIVVTVNKATADLVSNDVDNIICLGQTIRFTASGGIEYDFVVDGTPQGASANNEFVYTGATVGNHTIFVRVKDANGCFDDSDVVFNIQVLPLPVAVLNVDNSNPVCDGTTLRFTASGGVNYTFYVNDAIVQPLSINNIFTTNSLNNGDVVHVVVANNNDCESVSNKITAQILDLPVITLTSNKVLGCENELLDFTAASPSAGMQYEFIVNGNNTVQGPSALSTLTYGAADNFTIQVRGEDANGCVALSNVLNITVSKVNPTLVATSNITCFGEPVRLTATGGVNYEFFRNGTSVQDGASNLYDYMAFDSGNQLFTVLVTNADGCTKVSSEVAVFVNDLPSITFTDDDADNTVCAGESVTFSATGGDAYEFFVNNASVQGPSALSTCSYAFAGEGVYNVYVQVTNTTTGCALGSADIVITANPVPVATLTAAPSTNIIEGTTVTFTAGEPGREYEFYVNGTKIQDKSANNLFVSNLLNDGDVVTAYVYNLFSCYTTASLTVHVLEGVDILNVVPAVANYCEGAEGVTVSVANPQGGVTYRLVHQATNTIVGAPIEFNGGAGVSWSDVKVQPGHNPSVYIVEAYYALLPAEVFQMANTVTITENPLPTVFKFVPYNAEFTGCAAVEDLKLDGSELNVRYSLLLNGIALGVVFDGTGNELNFGKQFIVGRYTIEARNIGSGCARLMDGYYKINGETVQSFNLTSDPANGNYCESAPGVLIGLDGSEANVRYRLYRNGVDTGEFVDGTGAGIAFGRQTVDGVYSVLIESASGCLYPMTGSVTVTRYSLPVAYDLSATNNGHYCAGDAGVEISVSGQQEGYIYTLLFNGNPVVPAVTHVGLPGAETIAFTFAGTYAAEGVYSVQATIPNVDCPQLMNGSVTVVADPLPTGYSLLLTPEVVCANEEAVLTVLGSLRDVEYALFIEGQPLALDRLNGTGGAINFNGLSLSGTYYVLATNLLTGCSFDNGEKVVLDVRPNAYLNEDLHLIPASNNGNCDDGDVIEVLNPQMGMKYTLVKFNATGYVIAGQSFVYDGTNARFAAIRDVNAEYGALVGYADGLGCEELIPDRVPVNVAGAVEVFELIGDDEICNGDAGVVLTLNGSQIGVTYSLYYEGALVGAPMAGTGNALLFDAEPLINEGEYYVVGQRDVLPACPVEMLPRFNLKVHPLPTSFKITGDKFYCNPTGSVISIEKSELNVTYSLQFVAPDGKKKVIEKVMGDGSAIEFGPQLTPGKYIVVAINNLTFCTSNMEGEVVVDGLRPDINSIVVDNPAPACGTGKGVDIVLPVVQLGVNYELRNHLGGVVAEKLVIDDTQPVIFVVRDGGEYTLWASYNGEGCMVQLNNGLPITVTILEAPLGRKVTSGGLNGCGSDNGFIRVESSEIGVTYSLVVADPSQFVVAPGFDQTGDGNDIRWDITYNGSGEVTYLVVASIAGNCEVTMATLQGSYKPAPTVLDLDATPRPYCHDDLGLQIDLPVGAEEGIYYRLFTGDPRVFLKGIEASATNTRFDGKYPAGLYYIQAVNLTTGCNVWMNDHIELVENANPDVNIRFFYSLEGREDDNFGMVGAGNLSLDNSSIDADYTLWVVKMDGTIEQVQTLEGTGAELIFDPVTVGGHYFVRAVDRTTLCVSEIAHRILVTENPLKAFDGFLNLKTTEVASSKDIINADPAMIQYSIGVDKIYSLDGITADQANVEFELITEFTYSTPSGETALFKTIGDVKLNAVTGLLEYTKKVGFYGSDSLRYRIRNKNIPGREDTGTIFIFAGNNDADEDNPFLIPNAFSPNEDGINDRFVVSLPKIIKEDGYRSKLEVFNRWGTLVYQSKGARYDNSWDGKSTEAAMVSIGDDFPSGTYFYVFKITFIEGEKHVSKELSGYIELRR